MSLLDVDERVEITIGEEYTYCTGNLNKWDILKDWDEKGWDTEYKPCRLIEKLSLPELLLLPNIICKEDILKDVSVTYRIDGDFLHIWISRFNNRFNYNEDIGYYCPPQRGGFVLDNLAV